MPLLEPNFHDTQWIDKESFYGHIKNVCCCCFACFFSFFGGGRSVFFMFFFLFGLISFCWRNSWYDFYESSFLVKQVICLFCLFGFLTSSSTTRLYRGRAPRQSVWQFYVLPHMRQSWETVTSVSAGHIILTPGTASQSVTHCLYSVESGPNNCVVIQRCRNWQVALYHIFKG